jgi:hypothetical protein
MPLFFFNVRFLKFLTQGGNNLKSFFKILILKLPKYYNIHILNIEWFLGKTSLQIDYVKLLTCIINETMDAISFH